MKTAKTQILILFIIRVCLWITALVSTGYWIWYSAKLHRDGIFDPYEYSTLLRPVLYTCVGITVAAVAVSFALYALTKRIRKKHGISRSGMSV